MDEEPIICNRCSGEIEGDPFEIETSYGDRELLCENCYESRDDCRDCQATGIGRGGPDTKCGACGGRGYKHED